MDTHENLAMTPIIRLDRLVQNTGLSLVSELVNRTANVILFVLVSRLLGVGEAGQYSVAFSYTLIATRLTFWGLDQLLIRDSSKDAEKLDKIFNNSLLTRSGLAIIVWFALAEITKLTLIQADAKTRIIVILFAVSTLPETVSNLCESVYIARERLHLVVLVRTLVTAAKLAGAAIVLLTGYGLMAVAWVVNVASFGGMVFNLALVYRRFVGLQVGLDLHFSARQMKVAWPLALSGALYILNNRLDILVLSLFVSEAEIGIYSAAVTVISALLLVSHAYRIAVFPAMARLFATNREALNKLCVYSVKYMVILSLPLAVLLPFSGALISTVLGNEFRSTSQILAVMAWLLPLLFLNVPIARLLVVADRQRIAASSMTLQLVANTALCLILVPKYGTLGAAWACLSSSFLMVLANYTYVSRHIQRIRLDGAPVYALASAAMGGTLILLHPHHYFAPLVGAGVYLGTLLLGGTFSEVERARFRDVMEGLVNRVQVHPD